MDGNNRPGKRAPPKLDLRAFQAPPAAAALQRNYPSSVLDTHLHLWTAEQLEGGRFKWPREEGKPAQLSGPHELLDYGRVTAEGLKSVGGGKTKWEGAVYVQAEAVHGDEDEDGSKGGWDASLDEVETVCAAALANPDAKILALAPWVPAHHGSAAISAYLDRVFALPSHVKLASSLGYSPIRSTRYLLQSSPRGFFSTPKFIEGLKELGKRCIAFDLTLDVRNEETGGVAVLEDAQEMIAKVREGQKEGEKTVFILDHFAKPYLTDSVFSTTSRLSPFQLSYVSALQSLCLLPHTYLKLSGFLDFAPPELIAAAFEVFKGKKTKEKEGSYATLRERVLAYVEPAVEAWGVERILVGSDWPMFRPHLFPSSATSPSHPSTSLADEAAGWAFEMQLYLDCFLQLGLEGEELDKLFSGNARRVYRLGKEA
ncbi:hypothetical protein JCM8547_005582 [Rhodosporidiobolus lusitaniae]